MMYMRHIILKVVCTYTIFCAVYKVILYNPGNCLVFNLKIDFLKI